MNKIYWGSHANILKSVINNISIFHMPYFKQEHFSLEEFPLILEQIEECPK